MPESQKRIKFENYEIDLVRVAFRRNLTIQVKPDLKKNIKIQIKAPIMLPEREILSFLKEKQLWLEKSYQKAQAHIDSIPVKSIKEGCEYYFLGQKLKLRFIITPLKKNFVSRDDHYLNIHWPINDFSIEVKNGEHPTLFKIVADFYKREAIKLITERVQFWSQETNLKPISLNFRNQKTRWGSCTSRGTISLNWKLICTTPAAIDYVIIHELCHLKHLNHSSNFWNLVSTHCPNYKALEKYLDQMQTETIFLFQN